MISVVAYSVLATFLLLGIYLLNQHQRYIDDRYSEKDNGFSEQSETLDLLLENEVKGLGYASRQFLGIGVMVETWGNVNLPITILSFNTENKQGKTYYQGICENGNYRITIDREKADTDNDFNYLIENKIINAQVLD